jgi:hypothetical protein
MGWVEINRDQFFKVIEQKGGIDKLRVYSAYTAVKGTHNIFGYLQKKDNIYTEWCLENAKAPILISHKFGDDYKYYSWHKYKGLIKVRRINGLQ